MRLEWVDNKRLIRQVVQLFAFRTSSSAFQRPSSRNRRPSPATIRSKCTTTFSCSLWAAKRALDRKCTSFKWVQALSIYELFDDIVNHTWIELTQVEAPHPMQFKIKTMTQLLTLSVIRGRLNCAQSYQCPRSYRVIFHRNLIEHFSNNARFL